VTVIRHAGLDENRRLHRARTVAARVSTRGVFGKEVGRSIVSRLHVGHADLAAGVDVDSGVGEVSIGAGAHVSLVREYGRARADVDLIPADVVFDRAGSHDLSGHDRVVVLGRLLNTPIEGVLGGRDRGAVRLQSVDR